VDAASPQALPILSSDIVTKHPVTRWLPTSALMFRVVAVQEIDAMLAQALSHLTSPPLTAR
jgi:hypothetical protein